jgi:hypothetical protein
MRLSQSLALVLILVVYSFASGVPDNYVYRAMSTHDFQRHKKGLSLIPSCRYSASRKQLSKSYCSSSDECCICHVAQYSSKYSSYISTSRQFATAAYYNARRRLGIVRVDLTRLPAGTEVIDLADPQNRKERLFPLQNNHYQCTALYTRILATADKEVLIQGEIPRSAYVVFTPYRQKKYSTVTDTICIQETLSYLSGSKTRTLIWLLLLLLLKKIYLA